MNDEPQEMCFEKRCSNFWGVEYKLSIKKSRSFGINRPGLCEQALKTEISEVKLLTESVNS